MNQRWISMVMLLVAWLALSGCELLPASSSRASTQQEATPTPIPTPIVPVKPTYRVQRGEVVKQVEFTGRIAPVFEQELFFQTDGRIRHVFVKRDDQVQAGQVLADLEIDDLERELASARLELERAQARLASAEQELANDIKQADVDLEIAQLKLEAAKVEDPGPREVQAAADLKKAEVVLQQAQQAYDEVAWSNDVLASEQAAALQQATLDYEQAQATYELAMQAIAGRKYELAIKEREVELSRIARQELDAGIDPLLKNDVQRAELNVQKLEADIADGQIIAPFAGRVLSLSLSQGREARAYQNVALVGDVGRLEVSADLQAVQLEELAEGMPATVVPLSRPGKQLQGRIRQLPYPYGGGGRTSGLTDETELDKSTRVSLDAADLGADDELGSLVRVTVLIEAKDNVLWLPPEAIRTFEGRKFVVVQEGELQRRVDVKVGIKSEDRVEIESGLTEGQVVIGE